MTSSFKPPETTNKPELSQPQPNTTIKDIEFLDGDISHSQRKCPSSITKLIGRYLVEFDKLIATRLWSTSKTCYVDRGRESLYVDPETDPEVPVARYRYGGSHQLFVVWLPGRDPSDGLEPAICKFRVYNNDGQVMRNGKSWLPLTWKTWVPQSIKHKAAQDIIRYIRDRAPNPKWIPPHTMNAPSLNVVDLDLDESKDKGQASTNRQSSTIQHTGTKRARVDSTVSNDYAQNGVSTPKRHKIHNAGQS